MKNGYVHPESLAETEWVAAHLDDPAIRLVESSEDYFLYDTSHIPGAVKLDWLTMLQDPLRRDILSRQDFEALCSKLGIANDTTVVFYGDKSNWFAAYALWIFRYYGQRNVKLMNGGRGRWMRENLPLVKEIPVYPDENYHAAEPDLSIRANRRDVLSHMRNGLPLVDVRSAREFSGELAHLPNYPQERAMRGGHIPGAVNIVWSTAVNYQDNTFKAGDEIRATFQQQGITPDKEIITYCRIGERSSFTWFVLTQLLGYPNVRNYDGSWLEWGNLIDAPIEKTVS